MRKKSYNKKHNDIKKIIEKRFNIITIIITLESLTLLIGLFNVQLVKKDKFDRKLEIASKNIIEGNTAPRGRIYDKNNKLIVDNKPVKVIYYQKPNKITSTSEINIAYKIAKLIDIDYEKLKESDLREFWVKDNSEKALSKIKEEEWKKLEERKLDLNKIEKLKKERITKEELDRYKDIDKKAAYIYYLMNKGYSYSEKIIKKEDVTDLEYASVASANIDGFGVRLDWKRVYPYEDTFKSIIGSISDNGIPEELKENYLKQGYELDDRVGVSYLEYEYDKYLKGEKNKYQINALKEQVLKEEGKRGNDLKLTIDIELQKAIEEILEKELLKAKREANTKYYNKSFVVVTDPTTGGIISMVGRQIVTKSDGSYEYLDYTPGILTTTVTPGSVVKGASHITGYNNGGLKIGEVRYDTCVKLKSTPQKCSWKKLGRLDDIKALQFSSNTYQFYTAMKVAGYKYTYNGAFKFQNDAFKIYRDTFKQFGLGVKTGVDLPNELPGYKGTNDTPGLLLDYSIGQYDTYTPLQIAQYMATIATGKRVKLHILDKVYSSKGNLEKEIYGYKPVILNEVETKQEYIDRVREGFKKVVYAGTGYGYINKKYKPAGKTGTSQSFIDIDNDGKVDKETLTNTFAGYAPNDNPEVVFAVMSPDVSNLNSNYTSSVNKRITRAVSDKYFELKGKN